MLYELLYNKRRTLPRAAVELDPHADSSRTHAVRHEADRLGDHRRVEVPHLADVRVAVTLEQLQPPPPRGVIIKTT